MSDQTFLPAPDRDQALVDDVVDFGCSRASTSAFGKVQTMSIVFNAASTSVDRARRPVRTGEGTTSRDHGRQPVLHGDRQL